MWLNSLQLSNSKFRRLPDFIQLGRLDRPIGIYLLLWPALWALWIAAEGQPSVKNIIIFILGVILTRTGGCVINDFADRNFDGDVQRTQNRPLATGRISPKEALLVASVIGLLCFALVLFTNLSTILWSIAALVLACTYPFMKRYTYFPQVVLGAAFAWSIPMAFAATNETVPHFAWLIYGATVLWTVAYDTLYAMVDRDDDIQIGLRSTAILFGDADLVMIAILEAMALLSLWLLGDKLLLSAWYYGGLVVASSLWCWQLWQCRQRDTQRCFHAFLHNHWVGASIFGGIFLHYSLA